MKASNMSKREKVTVAVVLAVSVLIALTFLVYAFIKANEAEKYRIMTNEAQQEAEMLRDQAVELQLKAMESAAQALKQQRLAEKELKGCQNKIQSQ